MRWARRTRYALFRCAEHGTLDVPALLQGQARVSWESRLRAVSILDGSEHELSLGELELLLSLPADRYEAVEDDGVERLALCGLALLRDGEGRLAELRGRDESIATAQWSLYGALIHALTRWRDVDAGALGLDEALAGGAVEAFVARYGPPPPHFHSLEDPLAVHELPLVSRDDGVFATLARRRTSRRFDRSRPVTEEELAVLLHATYGAQGVAYPMRAVAGVRKTSPSGGGLHPVEAYPLVVDVAGVPSGLYHYEVERHALELVAPLTRARSEELALEFTCGQEYFRGASVFVVLTARFGRSFWKYRQQEKAYGVVLMDAAHLSQTFYLVCAELGLGAFVTAAVNAANIDEHLGLDGFGEGALSVSGCGRLVEDTSSFDADFLPFVPRRPGP